MTLWGIERLFGRFRRSPQVARVCCAHRPPGEPVWHRATLDLLAALALIDTGRFVGTVASYRAGHTLDCRLVTLLYRHGLLEVLRG